MITKIIYRKIEYEIPHGMTIRSALEKLNIQPESVIPILNGELITDDMIINEGDVIRLVAVISGG